MGGGVGVGGIVSGVARGASAPGVARRGVPKSCQIFILFIHGEIFLNLKE